MPDIIHCDCGYPMVDTGEHYCCPACGAEVSYAVVAVWVWDVVRELAELLP